MNQPEAIEKLPVRTRGGNLERNQTLEGTHPHQKVTQS